MTKLMIPFRNFANAPKNNGKQPREQIRVFYVNLKENKPLYT
jgi:hypothetical protein